MAATKPTKPKLGLILLAAAALPGVLPKAAYAENAPERASISFKTLDYQDSQPGLERVHVKAPAISAIVPLGESWSIEGGYVSDTVSGATPRRSSAVSSASLMYDKRKAYDFKVMHYRERSAVGVSVSRSSEHDYLSKDWALEGRLASEDNNTTLNYGISTTQDEINPSNQILVGERRKTNSVAIGLTQAMTANDLLQINLTHGVGKGYYNDPYKLYDERPRERRQTALLLRWNHHFDGGSTLRTSYRGYGDSFGVRASTYDGQWVFPLSEQWQVTPGLRYYSQRSASFYLDPLSATDASSTPAPGLQYHSLDQRLSAFGAITLSFRVDYKINEHWRTDFKYARYEQRSNWNASGQGSPFIAPFSAQTVMAGVTYTF